MAFKKTAAVSGQIFFFSHEYALPYVYTLTNQTTGVVALPESQTTTNLTSSVVGHNTRIRMVFKGVIPNPPLQGQPTAALAFPAIELMTRTDGLLNPLYFKFVRRLVDGSAQDPSSAFGLKVLSSQLLNFNNTTQQPFTTGDDVLLEVVLGVADAASGKLVADLESSRAYDLDVVPELLIEWYNF
jgi:hypothetical protein